MPANALLSGAKLLAKIARNEASQLFSVRLSNLLVAVYLFIKTNIKIIEAIGKHIKLRKLQYFLFVREYKPRQR